MFVEVRERERLDVPWATPLIIALCGLVGLYEATLDSGARLAFIREYGTVPSQLTAGNGWGDYLRLVSAVFLHVDPWHLFGNLLFLLLFGWGVERVFRSRWCLLIFLCCGSLANLATAVIFSNVNAPIVGCSGAVSGLIGAYLLLFPRATLGLILPLGLYFQFVRVPAQHLIGLWLFLQVLYTIASPSLSQVAWLSHVVGFVTGFVLAITMRPWILRKTRPSGI